MAKNKTDAESLTDEWLAELDQKVSELLEQGCTQGQLRKALTHSYINFFKGKDIKDGGKIIETLAKIAPAKADPIESGLEEPVSAVSRADELLLPLEEGQAPTVVSSADMLAEGEKEKLTAAVAEPYRQGDTVTYTRETPHDALQESVDEVVTGEPTPREERYEAETYDPADFEQEQPLREVIDGEVMTEESGLGLDEIRHNMEEARAKRYPEYGTRSIPEMDQAINRRVEAKEREGRKEQKRQDRKAEKEERRRKWAEAREAELAELKRKKQAEREARREAWRKQREEGNPEYSTASVMNREEEADDVLRPI